MLYTLFKKLLKPLKYGAKYGKAFIATLSLATHKKFSSEGTYISQSIGLILFPIVYLLIEPLTKKLAPTIKEKIPLIFYTGLALGNALGSFLTSTVFYYLPSSFSNGISTLISLLAVTILALASTVGFSKIKKYFYPELSEDFSINQFAPGFRYRFRSGLESGFAIGTSLGASLEFIFPGLGLLGSAIGGVVGTCLGIGVVAVGPSLLNKWSSATADSTHYPALVKSVKLGVLLGSCFGMVVGTFLLPGIGTVLGGLIFAGAGTVLTSSCTLLAQHFYRNEVANISPKMVLSNLTLGVKISMSSFSLIGGVIGTCLLPGLGTAGGAAMGALIGCMLGGICSLYLTKRFKNLSEVTDNQLKIDISESKALSKPTFASSRKQCKIGFSMGSTIGTLVGAVVGSCLPVVGTLLGGLAGGLIGGLLGIVIPTVTKRIKISTLTPQESISAAPQLPSTPHELVVRTYGTSYSSILNKGLPSERKVIPLPIESNQNRIFPSLPDYAKDTLAFSKTGFANSLPYRPITQNQEFDFPLPEIAIRY